MTHDEILADWKAKSPRQKDIAVAEALGWIVNYYATFDSTGKQLTERRPCETGAPPGTRGIGATIPHYTTTWEGAGLVIAEMKKLHPDWRFGLLGGDVTDTGAFRYKAEWFGCYDSHENTGQRHGEARADTAPEAISLAAKLAVEGENAKT